VLLVLGGAACLAIARALVLAIPYLAPLPEYPSLMRVAAFLAAGIFVFGALWQVVTVAGLWRMKPWGRLSILAFAGVLAPFQLLGMILMFLPSFVGGETGGAADLMPETRNLMLAFYAATAAIGVGWLVYFTRPHVKAAFAGKEQRATPSRPVSIPIIGWTMVLTGVFWPFAVYGQWPGVFLWMVLPGWSGVAVNTIWCIATVYAGVEVLRGTRIGYDASVWLLGVAGLTVIAYWFVPGAEERLRGLIGGSLPGVEPLISGWGFWLLFVVALLGVLAPLGYLYVYREEFTKG